MASDDLPAHVLFARRARSLREALGCSTRGLADMAGVAASTVSRIESGKQWATLDAADAIARALGVPLGDMTAPDGCDRCAGSPPAGFTCNACGAESPNARIEVTE